MKVRAFKRYWLKKVLKTQEDRNEVKKRVQLFGFKATVHNQMAMHIGDVRDLR